MIECLQGCVAKVTVTVSECVSPCVVLDKKKIGCGSKRMRIENAMTVSMYESKTPSAVSGAKSILQKKATTLIGCGCKKMRIENAMTVFMHDGKTPIAVSGAKSVLQKKATILIGCGCKKTRSGNAMTVLMHKGAFTGNRRNRERPKAQMIKRRQ